MLWGLLWWRMAATVELSLAPHEGQVFLATSPGGSAWFLNSSLTYEKKRLPRPADGAWSLEFDRDGHAYVDDGETSTWVSELFQVNVWTTAGGEQIFRKGSSSMTSWEFFSGNKSLLAQVPMGLSGQLVDYSLWLCRKRAGCSLWWSLGTLYRAAGLSLRAGNASSWVHRRTLVWCRWLLKLSLGDVHFRRSKPYGA